MPQKYLDFMLTTISAFMILSPALQSAGLPANVKAKFPTIIGKSKAVVDKVLGKGIKSSTDWEPYVGFTYKLKGTQSVEVVYAKNLKSSVSFDLVFPNPEYEWKTMLGDLGFKKPDTWKLSGKGVSGLNLPSKHWQVVIRNEALNKAGYEESKKEAEKGGYGVSAYTPLALSSISIFNGQADLP